MRTRGIFEDSLSKISSLRALEIMATVCRSTLMKKLRGILLFTLIIMKLKEIMDKPPVM
jgi:hypothetical protein